MSRASQWPSGTASPLVIAFTASAQACKKTLLPGGSIVAESVGFSVLVATIIPMKNSPRIRVFLSAMVCQVIRNRVRLVGGRSRISLCPPLASPGPHPTVDLDISFLRVIVSQAALINSHLFSITGTGPSLALLVSSFVNIVLNSSSHMHLSSSLGSSRCSSDSFNIHTKFFLVGRCPYLTVGAGRPPV